MYLTITVNLSPAIANLDLDPSSVADRHTLARSLRRLLSSDDVLMPLLISRQPKSFNLVDPDTGRWLGLSILAHDLGDVESTLNGLRTGPEF